MLSPRKTVLTVLATASTLLGTSSRSRAQMPGTPVLQNAFANPGITGALDVASLGGASSYAAAGAWAPGSAHFQFSGGIGVQTRTSSPTRTVYGFRLNVPLIGATGNFGAVILNLAGLSFLGLGMQPPTPEWGEMINEAARYFQEYPWQMIAPGLCIAGTVLAINLLGDGLRDVADPRTR